MYNKSHSQTAEHKGEGTNNEAIYGANIFSFLPGFDGVRNSALKYATQCGVAVPVTHVICNENKRLSLARDQLL